MGFNFRLQSILKLRIQNEKNVEEKLGKAIKKYDKEKMELNELQSRAENEMDNFVDIHEDNQAEETEKEFENAAKQSELIINEAKSKAKKILDDAEGEALKIITKLREDAHKEGYEEGSREAAEKHEELIKEAEWVKAH